MIFHENPLQPLSGSKKHEDFKTFSNCDNCCFMSPYAAHFKKYSDNLSSLKYNVIIDESDTHTMNAELVLSLLENME